MGRVSTAVLLTVLLLPTHGAAQTASLPPSSSPAGPGDVFRAGPRTYSPNYDRPQPYTQYFTAATYYRGGVKNANDPSPITSRYMARGNSPGSLRTYEPGRLRLDIVPSSARVYVDGAFIGTVDEINFNGGGHVISPGSHYVSVRARGYESDGGSVMVLPGQSTLYRAYLDRDVAPVRYRSEPPYQYATPYLPFAYPYFRPVALYGRDIIHVALPLVSPGPMYVIPGCYAGDAMPRPEKLLPGCKLENLRRVWH
jgi:hypothetical protein